MPGTPQKSATVALSGQPHRDLSTRQLKAARALVGWSQENLTAAAGVSLPTLKRLEAIDGVLGGSPDTRAKLISALSQAGIIFIDGDGQGAGVRLRTNSVVDPI